MELSEQSRAGPICGALQDLLGRNFKLALGGYLEVGHADKEGNGIPG